MAQVLPGYQWLANAIAASGTEHVFFIDAVLRRTLVALEGVGVKRHLAHTEQAVVYMADGYARLSGKPAFCFAQSVGAANLAAALQDPFLGRSPIVALTGHKPLAHQHRNAYQEIPHAPLFAPVTSFSADVNAAADLPRALRQALRAATAGVPRPVHLDLNGLAAEIVEAGAINEAPVIEAALMRVPSRRTEPASDEVSRAAAALLAAKRVAIVAGEGALLSDCGDELLALAEILHAPLGTSLGARGLAPTLHGLSIGVVGSYSAPPANEIVYGADLVLFVGCDTGDQVTHAWRIPDIETPVVQIDIDPLELGRSYKNTIGICADPKAALAQLIGVLGAPVRDSAFARWAGERMVAWRAEMAAKRASNESPIRVERLCAEIERHLPSDGVLVADTGFSGIWTGTCIEMNGRGQNYLRAAGSLGWAYPAALGAKLAAGKRKVICFAGDGAFYYNLSELETARRRGIATVTVVNNNSGFGQGWPHLVQMQGDIPGHPEEMLRFTPINFADVARGFGVHGIRVETADQIGPALEEALALDAPVVVDVVTDINARAPEPWSPDVGARR